LRCVAKGTECSNLPLELIRIEIEEDRSGKESDFKLIERSDGFLVLSFKDYEKLL
jgi:hypothetical protein